MGIAITHKAKIVLMKQTMKVIYIDNEGQYSKT